MSDGASTSIRRDRPWHALSVRLALGAAVVGGALWAYSANSQQAEGGLTESAPAVTRFALSFLGGFAIGWTMRRFLKWTILTVALIALAIFVLRKTGLIELPWNEIQKNVEEGSTWLQAQASGAKKLLTGWLPSGFAAVIGGFLGFRR